MERSIEAMATETVVQGIVVPTVWDSTGNPLRVSILTEDEGEYRVIPRGMGRRLVSYVTEEIRARVVAQGDGDEDVVKVVSFTIVGPGNTSIAKVDATRRGREEPHRSTRGEKPRGSHGRNR
jgi:hypothetical protein